MPAALDTADPTCRPSQVDHILDLKGPLGDLVTGPTNPESETVRFWYYKLQKSKQNRATAELRDDWIQEMFNKALNNALHFADETQPPVKRAWMGKGKGKGVSMEEDEVDNLQAEVSDDEEEDV
jgi:hypothetical protein